MDLSNWRNEYDKYSLSDNDLPIEPFALFNEWFDKATIDNNPEPNAFVLTTCQDQKASSRIVLLKEIEEKNFVFYSNYKSQKAADIQVNPNVSMLFFYPYSQRQIRIEGTASKLSRKKAVAYFKSRPIESQISAIASPQSAIITKEELINRATSARDSNQYDCPENWGGYAIAPSRFEFWQGQPARLHDRIIFEYKGEHWEKHRLAP